MDFKIDFNIDFSDNEFEKYLANPTKYVEDAKARMRKEAYERANAELEATRQKAVAFAKLNSELNAYQQELKVEIDQYMKAETRKLIASVGNSTAPRAESQLPSPRAESQLPSPQEDKSKPNNTAKPQRAAKGDTVSFNPNEDVLGSGGKAPYSPDKNRMKTKGKPTLAERIRAERKKLAEQEADLKSEIERYTRNTIWDAIFSKTNNEYSSDNVYLMLQDAKIEGDDKALGDAIRDAVDNGINYEDLVALTHDQMENRLGEDYRYGEVQEYIDRIYNEYIAPGAEKQTSFNNPADKNEQSDADTQDAITEFKKSKRGGF